MNKQLKNCVTAILVVLVLFSFSCSTGDDTKAEQNVPEQEKEVKVLTPEEQLWVDFLITKDELNLNFKEDAPPRRLSFGK